MTTENGRDEAVRRRLARVAGGDPDGPTGDGASDDPCPRQGGRATTERGQVTVIVALFIVVLVSMVALAVDLGFAYLQQRHMSNNAASAAAAGQRLLILASTGAPPSDVAVQQAMTNTLLASNSNSFCWDTSTVGPSCASTKVQGGRWAIQAEYVYHPAGVAQNVVVPSGVLVGSLGASTIPTRTWTYADANNITHTDAAYANGIRINYTATNAPTFFARVQGRQTISVQSNGYRAAAPVSGPPIPPSSTPCPPGVCTPTSTPAVPPTPTNTVGPTPTSVPCIFSIPSSVQTGQGFYTVFTTTVTADITATWTVQTGSSSYSLYLALYSGMPLGSGTGTSTRDPSTDSGLTSTPPQLTLSSQKAVNGQQTENLLYPGAISGTYTVYFFNTNNKADPVLAASVGYQNSVCTGSSAPLPTPTTTPPATSTPAPTNTPGPTNTPVPTSTPNPYPLGTCSQYVIWGGNSGGLWNQEPVYLWGDQWDSQNGASGSPNYQSNPRFKGWIDTLPSNLPAGACSHATDPAWVKANLGAPPTPVAGRYDGQCPPGTLTNPPCWSALPGGSGSSSAITTTSLLVWVTTYVGKSNPPSNLDYGNIVALVQVDGLTPGTGGGVGSTIQGQITNVFWNPQCVVRTSQGGPCWVAPP